jgi:hypothetical protein
MRQVAHQGRAQVHQGNHLGDQSDSGMVLLGHPDLQREDRRQVETGRVEGNSAEVAAAADAADPVDRHLDETETVVPVTHVRVSR